MFDTSLGEFWESEADLSGMRITENKFLRLAKGKNGTVRNFLKPPWRIRPYLLWQTMFMSLSLSIYLVSFVNLKLIIMAHLSSQLNLIFQNSLMTIKNIKVLKLNKRKKKIRSNSVKPMILQLPKTFAVARSKSWIDSTRFSFTYASEYQRTFKYNREILHKIAKYKKLKKVFYEIRKQIQNSWFRMGNKTIGLILIF